MPAGSRYPNGTTAPSASSEGAFGFLGAEDDPIGQPLSILGNISRSLKQGAKALLTVLNGAAKLRRSSNEDVMEGRFDLDEMEIMIVGRKIAESSDAGELDRLSEL
jgi:hypothetical protein